MNADDHKRELEEEAIAEEEFVADIEDRLENPLVPTEEKVEEKPEPSEEKPVLPGAIGTGDLEVEIKTEPINNEEALRSESVNNDENPFGAGSAPEKEFGGPNTAPLGDATETIAPTAPAVETPTSESAPVAEAAAPAAEPVAAAEPTQNPFTTAEPAADTAATTDAAAATPAATPTVADLASDAQKPRKKKKIVGIVIAIVLLLLLIGGGLAFYLIHESDDKYLSDALSNAFTAKAAQFNGSMTLTSKDPSKSGIEKLSLTFQGDENAKNFSGSGSIELTLSGSKMFSIDVAGAYISSNGIYVKLDKLQDTLKEMNVADVFNISGDEQSSRLYANVYGDILNAVAKEIDGHWYVLNADTFGDDAKSKETYDCLTKAIDDMSSDENKTKMSESYKSHPFIKFDEGKKAESADGLKYFYVKSDDKEAKAFADDVSKMAVVKDLKACVESTSSSSSGSEEDEDDEEEVKADVELKLGIAGWSHELKAVKGTVKDDDSEVNIDVKIGYENKEVSAPSDATNLADAGKKILNVAIEAFSTSMTKNGNELCEKEYAGQGQVMVDYCKAQVKESVDSTKKQLEKLFDNGIGGIIQTGIDGSSTSSDLL